MIAIHCFVFSIINQGTLEVRVRQHGARPHPSYMGGPGSGKVNSPTAPPTPLNLAKVGSLNYTNAPFDPYDFLAFPSVVSLSVCVCF